MSSSIPLVVVVLVLALVVVLVWLAMRSGGNLIAARNATLARVASGQGLQVRTTGDVLLFAADGTTAAGVPLRINLDRVSGTGHNRGTHWVLRLVARPNGPRPAILARLRRRASTLTENAPNLHEISTGDAAFDGLFVTAVENDDEALALLRSGLLTALAELRTTPLSGVEVLKVGSEVALNIDCTFDSGFFDDGRLERAIAIVVGVAS